MKGNQDTNALAPQQAQISQSERFTQMVMREYNTTGKYQPTEREKQLIRNYFICIDQTLQTAEADRQRKNAFSKNPNDLPYTWNNVDLPSLAQDLAHYARVGLDMAEDNMLFPIPYKNNKGNKYTMTLMEGYNGIKYQATKYALDPFKAVTIEVVYSNDTFRPIKKDSRNPYDTYEFEIGNPFDRGAIVGVFGYIEYDDPTKNRLVIFTRKDVEKRKPKYASPEFWGGEKTVYEKGKATKVMLDGWEHEMFEKTMKREIYGAKHMPRDPDKVDESYQYIRKREQQYADMVIEAEIVDNANRDPVELPPAETPAQPEYPIADLTIEGDSEGAPDADPGADAGF